MSTDPASIAKKLQALPSGKTGNTTRNARIAQSMPDIRDALTKGVTAKKVCEALSECGIPMSVRSLFRHIALDKARESKNKTGLIIQQEQREPKPKITRQPVNQQKNKLSDQEALKQVMREEVDLVALAKLGKAK